MRSRAGIVAAIAAICAAGCERTAPTDEPRPEPVVVYASHEVETYLPALFEGFTEQTGIRVTMRYADEHENVGRVIANRGVPPADVVITPSIGSIWQAAEEGALIPQRSAAIDIAVPDKLRDPDRLWTGLGYRSALIVIDPDSVDSAAIKDYSDLAAASLAGGLCLSSSQLSVNRSLIAMLINALGRRPAEVLVRGWMANLGHPVFDSETELLAAIEAGTCKAGIASSSAYRLDTSDRLVAITPDTAYVDLEAAGIARHARNPDSALLLIEWLVSVSAQQAHSAANGHYPVNPNAATPDGLPEAGRQATQRRITAIGLNNEEALLLAERAAYR